MLRRSELTTRVEQTTRGHTDAAFAATLEGPAKQTALTSSRQFSFQHRPCEFDFRAPLPALSLSFVELSTPAPDLLGRKAFDVAVVELPVGAGTPPQRGMRRGPRGWGRL